MSTNDRFAERIPWYVNGTIDETEASAVERHLAGCESCRRRLADARLLRESAGALASVEADHVSERILVDYFERPGSLEPHVRLRVEAHLSTCASCRAEIGILSEEPNPREAPADRRSAGPGPVWRFLAVAASLLLVVGLSGWFATWRKAAGLEARLARATSPAVNVPVLELIADSAAQRGEAPATRIEAGVFRVGLLLLLPADDAEDTEYAVAALDATDRILWSGRGLRRDALGYATIDLPADLLPDGEIRFRLTGVGRTQTYRVKIQREQDD